MTEEQIKIWKKNAKKAGFKEKAIYENESKDTAFKLTGHGFVIQIYNRPDEKTSIHGWGPDGLTVEVPETFSLETLQRNLNKCMFCGKQSEIMRISFSGRCCHKCLEENLSKYEFPGWTK